MTFYNVIYADPPWSFSTYSAKGKGRSAEAHYDCMSVDDLKALPIAPLANADCVLLMWTTDPFIPIALDLITTWSFQYKTVGFYWVKCAPSETNMVVPNDRNWPIGTGYWTRANPEMCLLATRGHPHRVNADVRKLIIAPRREHSRKPDETYDRIERLCSGPYVELFARQRRPGWDIAFSDQAATGPTARRWTSTGGPIQ